MGVGRRRGCQPQRLHHRRDPRSQPSWSPPPPLPPRSRRTGSARCSRPRRRASTERRSSPIYRREKVGHVWLIDPTW